MSDPLYDTLQQTLTQQGASAALDQLCAALRERKDYANLFYALLMKKRHELGVHPVPTAPSTSLPAAAHEPYEQAIRTAATTVGNLFLGEGNIAHAWAFFRMLGETEPIRQALDNFAPREGEELHPIIDIAFHQGVHPRKGFDLILENYGICNAITTLGGQEFAHGTEARDYCLKRLIRALHTELGSRLRTDIGRQEGKEPDKSLNIPQLLEGRPWLFEDDIYHIDISHLGSVVQMSIHLEACPELNLARELCEYGKRLSPRFQYANDPPFDKQYHDYAIYLAVLMGDNVDAGLAHFRAKLEDADPNEIGTYPAEVLVNLLLKVKRPQEALAVARKHLANVTDRRLNCPSIVELCELAQDYGTLAEVAREQDNVVHFLAGRLAAQRS